MRLTIVPGDNVVTIDGITTHELDLSTVAPDVHAVQWYGDRGEEEIVGEFGRIVANREITDLDAYQTVIDQFLAAEQAKQIAEARAAAELTIIEV